MFSTKRKTVTSRFSYKDKKLRERHTHTHVILQRFLGLRFSLRGTCGGFSRSQRTPNLETEDFQGPLYDHPNDVESRNVPGQRTRSIEPSRLFPSSGIPPVLPVSVVVGQVRTWNPTESMDRFVFMSTG